MKPSASPELPASETGPGLPWLAFLVPLVVSAATRDLWAPDEPRYAQVAKEIFERGDPIVMHLCGDVYPNKPPLLFALAGLFGRLGGWSELAMRLPVILATALTAWLTVRFARRFWGESEARWSAVVYLTTAMMVWNGARLQLDAVLGVLCFGALTLIDEPARDELHARRRLRWAGVLTGLGVLVKGPVAYLFVLLPPLVWRMLLGKSDRPRSRRGVIEGVVLALALPLAWAGAAIAREPALMEQLLFKQHMGQTMDGSRHPAPFWYHLEVQPGWMVPWVFAFVAGLALAGRAWRERRAGREHDVGALRAASWFVALFVVFSCFTSKRDLYLVPVYPAVGLLVARWLVVAVRAGRSVRLVGLPSAALLFVAGLAIAVEPFFADELAGRASFPVPEFGWRAHVAGGVLALLAAMAFVQGWRGRSLAWARTLSLAFASGATLIALCLFPPINPTKSARKLANDIVARTEKPTSIPIEGAQPEGYRFYGAPVRASDTVEAALVREGPAFLAVMQVRTWEKLDPALRTRLVELQRRIVGSRTMLLVGRRNE
ncbi:MAG: glycosyltransferase family 39 protein [Planctomycetes bacterium]|nr:glycosyltransferase family 39 protein [Planctomycetota bacterium]